MWGAATPTRLSLRLPCFFAKNVFTKTVINKVKNFAKNALNILANIFYSGLYRNMNDHYLVFNFYCIVSYVFLVIIAAYCVSRIVFSIL